MGSIQRNVNRNNISVPYNEKNAKKKSPNKYYAPPWLMKTTHSEDPVGDMLQGKKSKPTVKKKVEKSK